MNFTDSGIIVDEVLPVPDMDTLRDRKIAELQEAGFIITNFHSGGIFYTMLMIDRKSVV